MLEPDVLRQLERQLDHVFQDDGLLLDALTHRSFRNERPDLARGDYERLEFVGDAVFELAASHLLFERFPEAREGELSRRRADLVCESSLAAIGREMQLGEALRLGRGEERSGGRDKARLIASSLEACVAAVMLDAGVPRALEVATRLLRTRLTSQQPGEADFKSRLQEALQGLGWPSPVYRLVRSDGPDHARVFVIDVRVGDRVLAVGSGTSKLRAEQTAAEAALAARLPEPPKRVQAEGPDVSEGD